MRRSAALLAVVLLALGFLPHLSPAASADPPAGVADLETVVRIERFNGQYWAQADALVPGDEGRVRVVLHNYGPDEAINTSSTVTLPTDLELTGHADAPGVTCNEGVQTVTCDFASFGATESSQYEAYFTVAENASGSETATTSVASETSEGDDAYSNSAEATTEIATPGADLRLVSIDDQQDTAPVGARFPYVVTIANDAWNRYSSGAVLTDVLPAGLEYDTEQGINSSGSSVDCAFDSETLAVTCVIGLIHPQTSVTIDIPVIATAPGLVVNSAVVAGQGDTNPDYDNDSASDSTEIVDPNAEIWAQADTPSTATPFAGDDFTFNLLGYNSGPAVAEGVTISSVLPAGLEYVSSYDPATASECSYDGEARTVVCELGQVPAGDYFGSSVVVRSATTGTYSHNFTVATTSTETSLGNNELAIPASVTVIDRDFDLSSEGQQMETANLGVGGQRTLTLTVGNSGPTDAAGVSVVDTLPPGTSLVSGTTSDGGSCVEDLGVVTCDFLAPIPAGEGPQGSVELVLAFGAAGTFSNTATVVSDRAGDANGGNDSSTFDYEVLGTGVDFALLVDTRVYDDTTDPVEAYAAPAVVGTNIRYRASISNSGANAGRFLLVDELPAGLAFVSATPAAGGPTTGSCTEDAGVIMCDLSFDPDAPDWATTVDIVVTPTAATPPGTPLHNVISVVNATDGVPESDVSDNEVAADTAVVENHAEVSVSASVDPHAPQSVPFDIDAVVTSTGPARAADSAFAVTVPASVTVNSVRVQIGATWVADPHCTVAAHSVTCAYGSLDRVDSRHLRVNVTASQHLDIAVTAAALSSTPDQHTADNSVTVTSNVDYHEDVYLADFASDVTVTVGDIAAFAGRTPVTGGRPIFATYLTAAFPAGLATADYPAVPGPASTYTSSYSGDLGISLGLLAQSVGTYSVELGAVGYGYDPDLSNNTRTVTVHVVPREADIDLLATFSAGTPSVGDTVFLTMESKNWGPSYVRFATFSINVGSDFQLMSTGGGLACTLASGVLTCDTSGSLFAAAGSSFSRSVGLKALTAGTFAVGTSVSSTTPDPGPRPNATTAAITVLPTTGSISGTLTSTETGLAVSGADVRVWSVNNSLTAPVATTTTDAVGHYAMPAVAAGSYLLQFGKSGAFLVSWYSNAESRGAATTVVLPSNGSIVANQALRPTRSVAGRVTNRATGAPVAGARVLFYNARGAYTGLNTLTDADGNYQAASLAIKTYDILVVRSGFVDQWFGGSPDQANSTSVPVTATNAPVADFSIVTDPPSTAVVQGTVLSNGLPVAGVSVRVWKKFTDSYTTVLTDAGGHYIMNNVPAGTYQVQYAKTGYGPRWNVNATARGSATDVTLGVASVVILDVSI